MVNTTENNAPSAVREYMDALKAYNLRAAEWLGLDPSEVFEIDVDERDAGEPWSIPGVLSVDVTWEAIGRTFAPKGRADVTWGMKCDGESDPVHTGSAAIGDGESWFDEVGHKPKFPDLDFPRRLGERTEDRATKALAEVWQEGHESACQDVDYVCERIHPNPYRS